MPLMPQPPLPPSRIALISPQLKWDKQGLITTVVQDATSLQVLMVAWANEEALDMTMRTGEAHFWSRSRSELWHKGATSGNVMHIQDIRVDCDGDTLLYIVDPSGPACHTGAVSCFFRSIDDLTPELESKTDPEHHDHVDHADHGNHPEGESK